ncbi:hypothetical protein RM788_04800 [Umezawaea sp. Da 62-37]|nr:hypothetical protein [Umezawaea sp. Da 62-37]WNV87627.1 hypothetical protein RM788_04800 [Umezawaea sp. Da 62-37]
MFSGTLNGTGSLRVQVDHRAGDFVLARIATLVQDASRTKMQLLHRQGRAQPERNMGPISATRNAPGPRLGR